MGAISDECAEVHNNGKLFHNSKPSAHTVVTNHYKHRYDTINK